MKTKWVAALSMAFAGACCLAAVAQGDILSYTLTSKEKNKRDVLLQNLVVRKDLSSQYAARRARLEAAYNRVAAFFKRVCPRKPSAAARANCEANAERIRLNRLAQWNQFTSIRNAILAKKGLPLLSTTPPDDMLSPVFP